MPLPELSLHFSPALNTSPPDLGDTICASSVLLQTPCLTTLDLRNCDMNDRSIPIFGRALKLGSHLTVLHMENMYLSGRSLIILGTVSAMYVSVCLNCLCAQYCTSWHGISVHFFLSETWFAKTSKCKSGVPRKKHFYKGSALCVCVCVRERERERERILAQIFYHNFAFLLLLCLVFCSLQNTVVVFCTLFKV